jgi:hypothetical protein
MHRTPVTDGGGPAMVAVMARLTRVTQGERLFTLRYKWALALKHHAGDMTEKSSKSRIYSTLWNILNAQEIHDYQL